MARTLGILLTTSPDDEDGHTVRRIIESASAQGVEVRLFVMCDGVYHLLDPAFHELARRGVSIVCCGQDATKRHLDAIEGVPNLRWGSQYDFAQITAECDRILAFN